jgi:hypothetical protein
MDVRTRYTETVACAAATIGATERLVQFLKVSRQRLVRWLGGEGVAQASDPNRRLYRGSADGAGGAARLARWRRL